jgi:Uma2 family endonuclease
MVMETAFRSEERFSQQRFWRWTCGRPGDDRARYELVGGRIVMTPPPGWPHGAVDTQVITLLNRHVQVANLGIVLTNTDFELPSGDTLVPDVAFIATERFVAGPAPRRGRFLRIVPNLVGEVLSDSTAQRDRTEKAEIYAQNGIAEYWLADTSRCELTILVLVDGRFAEHARAKHGTLTSAVLPELAIPVEKLFGEVPRRA